MKPMPPLAHALMSPSDIIFAGITLFVLIVVTLTLVILARKYLRHSPAATSQEDWAGPQPTGDNASAFMTASMQGVIEKLRAQEKELARLHLVAQERAQESERLTEEVTRNMPTGLLVVSATGAIGSSNPAAEQALGSHSLRYRSYKEILGSDSDLARMLEECLDEGKTFQRAEVEHFTPDGECRRLGVTISPIYSGGRKIVRARAEDPQISPESKASGALCLLSDLTELVALQKQIRWKENLANLGEMSAGIAHEFKNALATVSGYAQMIRSEVPEGDTRESAERILDQTRALTHVVTEFLRFAKPLEISYETVPIQSIIERVASELQEAMPQATVVAEGTFTDLPGDEALLRQALINLVRNGIEAARASGDSARVVISGTMEELGGRSWQRIRVADNGPGIPDRDLPKIFLPFYTTKSEGTGLGLAVVQKIALQHGGSIEARNQAGGGAEFLLWLPLRQEPSPALFPSRAARI
ncbi:MAG: two-component system sensor histidine kinase NtrB [Candidatus Acidiferrales bacterium]